MSRQIFWDASAFLALSIRKDPNHKRAVEISRQLAKDKVHLVTTDAVLIEVGNGLSKVMLRPLAKQIINRMRQSVAENIATIARSSDVWEQGWELYLSRPDKAWGLTDCISMIVMKNYGIDEAFTADHHFAQAGFTCLLRE